MHTSERGTLLTCFYSVIRVTAPSVSGITTVLSTPPLLTKPSVDILRYPPESVPVVTQLVQQSNFRTSVDDYGTNGSRCPPCRRLTTNPKTVVFMAARVSNVK